MKAITFISLLFGLCSVSYAADKAGLFEIRQVFEKPSGDTVEMELAQKGDKKETLNVSKTALMDGSAIRSVSLVEDPIAGGPVIEIAFSNKGAQQFFEITAEHVGKRLAILLEGKVQTAPVVATRIPGGKAQIAGAFTKEEAGEMVRRINRALEVKDDRIRRDLPTPE
jgi:SecD/SecF fusion protein